MITADTESEVKGVFSKLAFLPLVSVYLSLGVRALGKWVLPSICLFPTSVQSAKCRRHLGPTHCLFREQVSVHPGPQFLHQDTENMKVWPGS